MYLILGMIFFKSMLGGFDLSELLKRGLIDFLILSMHCARH